MRRLKGSLSSSHQFDIIPHEGGMSKPPTDILVREQLRRAVYDAVIQAYYPSHLHRGQSTPSSGGDGTPSDHAVRTEAEGRIGRSRGGSFALPSVKLERRGRED